jgi:hypothetical protein
MTEHELRDRVRALEDKSSSLQKVNCQLQAFQEEAHRNLQERQDEVARLHSVNLDLQAQNHRLQVTVIKSSANAAWG